MEGGVYLDLGGRRGGELELVGFGDIMGVLYVCNDSVCSCGFN